MTHHHLIHENFKGYNGYDSIREAEKIIRKRHLENLSRLIGKIGSCEQKARDMRMIKILEKIMSIKNRMVRMKKEMEERDQLFMTEQMKLKITRVNEDKLKEIDYQVVELMERSESVVDAMTCSETDIHLIDKFSSINNNIRELEKTCHKRFKILKEEVL